MNLTAELNDHLRRVFSEMPCAAEVEDREERLRMMDQAVERADHLLIELVPTVGAEQPAGVPRAALGAGSARLSAGKQLGKLIDGGGRDFDDLRVGQHMLLA